MHCNLEVSMNKPIHQLTNEDSEKIINRFFKKSKEINIIGEIRSRKFYEKPSAVKNKKKRKIQHLKDINSKVVSGTLTPRNKRLKTQIMEDFNNGKIQVKRRNKR